MSTFTTDAPCRCGPIKISKILRSCFDRNAAKATAKNAEQIPGMDEHPREDDSSKSGQDLNGGPQASTPQPEDLHPAYPSKSRRTSSVSTVGEPRVVAMRPALSSGASSYRVGAPKILLVDDNLINLQVRRLCGPCRVVYANRFVSFCVLWSRSRNCPTRRPTTALRRSKHSSPWKGGSM